MHGTRDTDIPLIVDLDGTLTPADTGLEAFVRYARKGPLHFLRLLFWLIQGRSVAKAKVARATAFDPATLMLRPEVVAMVEAARASGRKTILASASHWRTVKAVAAHTGLFDDVIASTAKRNCKGGAKLAQIRAKIGDGPFDYIGDARADLRIWNAARRGYSCGYTPGHVTRIDSSEAADWRTILRTLRPHQWAKNVLIFVPLAAAGQIFSIESDLLALLAAVLFSLVASAIYQINDILDLEADRAHASKRLRPLASGALSIPAALGIATLLLAVSFAASALVFGATFSLVLALYLALTFAYSFRLKAVMTLDVITLACLYTLRLVAGAVAINVWLSSWLLLFSVFFFLSLGYLKRYTELAEARVPGALLSGRGYIDSDIQIVAMSGIAAGFVSILVMALFINDPVATQVYRSPVLLWGLPLLLLYWINRVWLMARRGLIDMDPVAYAVRDPRSLATGLLMAFTLISARFIELPF